jgi:hypothetical protein
MEVLQSVRIATKFSVVWTLHCRPGPLHLLSLSLSLSLSFQQIMRLLALIYMLLPILLVPSLVCLFPFLAFAWFFYFCFFGSTSLLTLERRRIVVVVLLLLGNRKSKKTARKEDKQV